MDFPEVFVPVKGFESRYHVSNYGQVLRIDEEEPRALQFTHNRYKEPVVILCHNNRRKIFTVKRLVALHFVPRRHGQNKVVNLDGNLENNRVDNLYWTTPAAEYYVELTPELAESISDELVKIKRKLPDQRYWRDVARRRRVKYKQVKSLDEKLQAKGLVVGWRPPPSSEQQQAESTP